MKTCDRYREDLSARLDHELTPAQEAELEAHLRECPQCRLWWEQMSRLEEALQDLEEEQAPEGFARRLMEHPAIAGHNRQNSRVPLYRRPLVRIVAGAAACLAICVGIWHWTAFRSGEPESRENPDPAVPSLAAASSQEPQIRASLPPDASAPEGEAGEQTASSVSGGGDRSDSGAAVSVPETISRPQEPDASGEIAQVPPQDAAPADSGERGSGETGVSTGSGLTAGVPIAPVPEAPAQVPAPSSSAGDESAGNDAPGQTGAISSASLPGQSAVGEDSPQTGLPEDPQGGGSSPATGPAGVAEPAPSDPDPAGQSSLTAMGDGDCRNSSVVRVTWHEDMNAPSARIVASVSSLSSFLGTYGLEESSLQSSYTEEYFAEKSLAAIVLEETSGSNQVSVSPQDVSDGSVTVDRQVADTGTTDMAAWVIVTEVSSPMEDGQSLNVCFHDG